MPTYTLRALIQSPMNNGKIYERAIEFSDWFDFADFAKQETEAGRYVTIIQWNYIPQAKT